MNKKKQQHIIANIIKKEQLLRFQKFSKNSLVTVVNIVVIIIDDVESFLVVVFTIGIILMFVLAVSFFDAFKLNSTNEIIITITIDPQMIIPLKTVAVIYFLFDDVAFSVLGH